MSKSVYITTTLPYVNADPHIGFALEIVQADIITRAKKLQGCEVFFNTGTDEYGVKIYRKALEKGVEPQAYVNEYAKKFRALKGVLGLSDNLHFIRTTDVRHTKAAQEFWRRCKQAGYIEKMDYHAKYCSGCELEKTDSELDGGKCPIHPNLTLETLNEENYFFKFSAFQEKLLGMYAARPDFVIPDFRFNEIKTFVARGLQDFSISRLKEKMPWGVPVPDDPTQVMYVWFDALVNYISTLGWPDDEDTFRKFWGTNDAPNALQFAGKDNLRQQSAMWQAMLMAAGLPPSKQIVIHGFIQSGGQKMSKSLGNVIDPLAIVKEYGTDALRYYLARHTHPFEDSDFTMEKFKESYNADLANGLGNLVARILRMSNQCFSSPVDLSGKKQPLSFNQYIEKFELNKALAAIWSDLAGLDSLIQEGKPFEKIKTNKPAAKKQLIYLLTQLSEIAVLLEPFMPETSRKIKEAIAQNKKPDNLFPRK